MEWLRGDLAVGGRQGRNCSPSGTILNAVKQSEMYLDSHIFQRYLKRNISRCPKFPIVLPSYPHHKRVTSRTEGPDWLPDKHERLLPYVNCGKDTQAWLE